ncbi:MAG: hypothetical protein ACODAU_04925 [Myxococcota bacterium]
MAAAIAVLAPGVVHAGLGDDFKAAERIQLRRGKLVTRPTEEQRGQLRLVGGMSWQVVDEPVHAVQALLGKPSEYEHLLPGVSSLREVKSSGPFRTVRICHARGRVEGCYHANMRFANEGRNVFFQLDPSQDNDLRAGWGFLRISKYGRSKTLVAWGVMADFGKGILAGLMRPRVREWMLKVPTTIKKHVERTYDET